jgi:hypothetical protein
VADGDAGVEPGTVAAVPAEEPVAAAAAADAAELVGADGIVLGIPG